MGRHVLGYVSRDGEKVTHIGLAFDDRRHGHVPPGFSTIEDAQARESAASAAAGGIEGRRSLMTVRSGPQVEPIGSGDPRKVGDTVRALSVRVDENDTAVAVENLDAIVAGLD